MNSQETRINQLKQLIEQLLSEDKMDYVLKKHTEDVATTLAHKGIAPCEEHQEAIFLQFEGEWLNTIKQTNAELAKLQS